MKFKYLAFFMALVAATGFAFAHGDKSSSSKGQHGMWTCDSNASSSSYTSTDNSNNNNNSSFMSSNNNSNKSDNTSSNSSSKQPKVRSAKEAFAFALKNCKDCTKITCEMQNQ